MRALIAAGIGPAAAIAITAAGMPPGRRAGRARTLVHHQAHVLGRSDDRPLVNGEEIHKEEMRGKGQPDKKPLTASAGHVKMRPDFLEATAELVSSPRSLVLLTTNLPWGFPGLGEALLGLSLALEGRCRRPGEFTAEHGHEAEPVPVGRRQLPRRRAFVRRVGAAVDGSSGHGCRG